MSRPDPWLLLVVVGCGGGGAATEPAPAVQWFTEITAQVGLEFTHEAGPTGEMHMPEIMGSGAALVDFDNDGDLDVWLTNGNLALPATDPPADGPTDRLWLQQPDGLFTEVTERAGIAERGYGMGLAVGDYDNDGFVDVYVTNYGPDRLWRNLGDGTFQDTTAAAGIAVGGWSSSAAFFDYDRDGFLDLYVARYVDYAPAKKCFDDAGQADYCGPLTFRPVPDVLLRNQGDGTFRDVSQTSGIASVAAAGLGVVCEDFDEDGLIDVYVANDAYANNLWVNQGDGTFRDEAVLQGVAYNLHGQAEAGMGVIAADFDGDGRSDLFMTHLKAETNTLYRNLGDARGFADATGESGLGPPSMAYTGFGTAALDVELDGDLDLLIANGKVNRATPLAGAVPPPPFDMFAEPNLFFLNDGRGRFTLLEEPVRDLCGLVEVSRGLAVGDVDADGDLDVLLTNIQGPARLYRNDAPRGGHWLSVRAVDPRLRRDALGARVVVVAAQRRWARTIAGAFSYQSANPPVAHFGLGDAASVDWIEVRWPDGLMERFPGGAVDRALELARGTGEAAR